MWAIISSLAREYSSHRSSDSGSIGDSFQRFIGSAARDRNRASCSLSETENQYLRSMIPSSMSICSKTGAWRRNRSYSASVQKPMTARRPRRLYQDPSKMTISPAPGRWAMYFWKYHWVSRVARRRQRRDPDLPGLRTSVIRLIAEPLPAASRPSQRTTTRLPVCFTHSCITTSSAWSFASSFS